MSRNLSRRLERLEDSLLPISEEPIVIKIIYVTPDGQQEDSGIEFKIPAVPRGPRSAFRTSATHRGA